MFPIVPWDGSFDWATILVRIHVSLTARMAPPVFTVMAPLVSGDFRVSERVLLSLFLPAFQFSNNNLVVERALVVSTRGAPAQCGQGVD